ncbi:MAG: peptide chain release factor N(5)-glutamine methyltransferase [Mycobacterium sp.]|nr:peptide chain release factor N(5)-glutamine methyltransferase [Mycobacterium sp.]
MSLRQAVAEGRRFLREAGVDSPGTDAELLAAHVAGVERGRLPLVDSLTNAQVREYRRLLESRAARVPVQHLTGTAPFGDVVVAVGPGVFVPRPETELLLDWGLGALRGRERPLVIDAGTGSGALALGIARARPDAQVHAIESDPTALNWARRNIAARRAAGDTPVTLHHGDITDPALLPEFRGRVDLVLSNPPYVPETERDTVPAEVTHDPDQAVFAGPDGLAVIEPLLDLVTHWLRPNSAVGIEHDECAVPAVAAVFRASGCWTSVEHHPDLAGRPRFTTARRQ